MTEFHRLARLLDAMGAIYTLAEKYKVEESSLNLPKNWEAMRANPNNFIPHMSPRDTQSFLKALDDWEVAYIVSEAENAAS